MTSNPLKWHGGKTYLAKRIIELMPKHIHYVEPYFGGGAVLFAKPCEGVSEVVNDINFALSDFWKVLQSCVLFAKFRRLIEAMPFSEVEFGRALNIEACADTSNTPEIAAEYGWRILAAAAFFARYRQSRQGLGKDFATLSRNRTRRGMNEQVSSWLSAIEGLPEAHERLKRVVILNDDALDVIRQQDGTLTHFYLDPPYLAETRTATDAYEHEMTEQQHRDLLSRLTRIKGTFQLSGYHSDIYDETARCLGWRCVEFDIANHSSGAKSKERKTECVWMNYDSD